MKRFLTFLVIAIAVVSLGLTIYYFSVDNEVIYIKSSYLVMNTGGSVQVRDEKNDLVDFRNRSDYTNLTYTIQQEEENDRGEEIPADKRVLSYNSDAGYILAQNGGEARIVINSNNRSYARLIVDVLVCDGSEDYPYLARNEQELNNMDLTKNCYKLASDITLTGNWVPKEIGTGKVFDGNYYTIKGMTITDNEVPNSGNVGFVSTLNGTIKNLFLEDININVNSTSSGRAVNIGSFAGVSNGIIQTSEASGVIKNTQPANSSYVGGIVGSTGSNSKIDRCGFDGTGTNEGLIITGANITAGGLVGANSARISESYSRGKVDNGTYGNTYFGGIVGTNSAQDNIYDCYFYATSALTTASQAAGIVYTQTSNTDNNFVTGCYYGGNIGILDNGLVKNGALHSDSNGHFNADAFKIQDNFVSITGKTSSNETYTRNWNFAGVWSIPTGSAYPILDVKSSTGSTYVDISDITPDNEHTINTIQKLYDAVEKNDADYNIDTDIDAGDSNYVWKTIKTFKDSGNAFTHAIVSTNGCTISNLTIDATDIPENESVGLVQKIQGGRFSGITFRNVTIIGANKTYKYVGVIAGESYGATIQDVTIGSDNTNAVDVNITGFVGNGGSAFGSVFGYADSATTLNRVIVKNVDVSDGYYTYAGGLVGINNGTITSNAPVNSSGTTTERNGFNYVKNVKVVANFAGGVAGTNAGRIENTTVQEFNYNNGSSSSSNSHTSKIYNSGSNVFVGGITGVNQKGKGYLTNVFSNNATIETTSGQDYKMYLGGIAGYTANHVSKAYAKKVYIKDDGSHNAFAGGITGYNSGAISDSVVDAESRIVTNINASNNVGTTVNGANYILNTDNCTIVGGLVGYDAQTTTNNYSIYRCASLMKEIKGFYAGGLVGIAFGKVQYAYCGESTQTNGGVTIKGYLAGGLTSVIAGGFMKNCYTFSQLQTADGNYNYVNVLSVVRMEVSAVGGLAVFALNAGTLMQHCYAVTTFSGSSTGVSYGSSADLTGFVCGTVQNCAYLNAGRIATRNGKQLTKNDLTGTTSFNNFKTAIAGNLGDWNLVSGKFPTIDRVNINASNSTLPKFD